MLGSWSWLVNVSVGAQHIPLSDCIGTEFVFHIRSVQTENLCMNCFWSEIACKSIFLFMYTAWSWVKYRLKNMDQICTHIHHLQAFLSFLAHGFRFMSVNLKALFWASNISQNDAFCVCCHRHSVSFRFRLRSDILTVWLARNIDRSTTTSTTPYSRYAMFSLLFSLL